MKLQINATIINDNGERIVSENLTYEGNKSGIVHAIKPMGEAIVYATSLGIYYKENVPTKDALGNTRNIIRDVLDRKQEIKQEAVTEKKL